MRNPCPYPRRVYRIMKVKRKAKLSPIDIEILLNATDALYRKCLQYNLECRDPYVVTSSYLYSLGYSQYRIRKLWKFLSAEPNIEVVIYKYKNSLFTIRLVYERGPVKHLVIDGFHIPVDDFDASRHPFSHIIFSPKAHRGVIYIEGRISEHINIKVNIIRILLLLSRYFGNDIVSIFLQEVRNILWGRSDKLASILLNFFNNSDLKFLEILLPRVPKTLDDLIKLSPSIRKIRSRCCY